MGGPDRQAGGAGGLVRAGTVQNPGLGEQARTRLEAAGIQATLQADPDIPTNREMALAGQVAIMVPADQLQQARQILDALTRDTDIPLEGESGA